MGPEHSHLLPSDHINKAGLFTLGCKHSAHFLNLTPPQEEKIEVPQRIGIGLPLTTY